MRVAVLGSGSAGNCLVVESAGRRILIDAGFSCREIEARCRRVGVAPETLEAVVVTHEHNDHSLGADRLARRLGLSVYATEGTLKALPLVARRAAAASCHRRGLAVRDRGLRGRVLLGSARRQRIRWGWWSPIAPGRASVSSPTSAAGAASPRRACRASTCWCSRPTTTSRCCGAGRIPGSLKQRVASRHGHLSNQQAAEALPELVSDRLRSVVLYHLSRTNNEPALARRGGRARRSSEPARPRASPSPSSPSPSSWMEVRQ